MLGEVQAKTYLVGRYTALGGRKSCLLSSTCHNRSLLVYRAQIIDRKTESKHLPCFVNVNIFNFKKEKMSVNSKLDYIFLKRTPT